MLISLIATIVCAQPKHYLGGDISLLPSYEEQGTVYKDYDGQKVSLLPFLKRQGWNMIRVRLFVDPQNAPASHKGEGVCQDLNYVIGLCRQIKMAGMQVMLDFHYSDTWADPGKQFTPKRWEGCDAKSLSDSVYAYTRRSLQAMKRAGVAPEMIQVGNEITNGMLWPVGKLDPSGSEGFDTLCSFLKAGCKACREVCPKSQIIIHTEKAGDWDITRNDNDPWAKPDQYSEFYPISVEGQTQFTNELVTELLRHHNVIGLFWWFPEENAFNNQVTKGWLNRGLFDNHTGQALPALREFGKYK